MEDIKLKVLKLIHELQYGDGVLFLKLKENLKDVLSWKELKLLLMELEEEGLIEERHFDDGRVDYKLEIKGYRFFDNLKRQSKTLIHEN
jgi:DNA-binding HxlR family transcriptional regulator